VTFRDVHVGRSGRWAPQAALRRCVDEVLGRSALRELQQHLLEQGMLAHYVPPDLLAQIPRLQAI
jgi:hypothetical protein